MQSIWSAHELCFMGRPNPRQVRFEAQRVRGLLRVFGLSDMEAEIVADYEREWGERRLTFESFLELVPTFPYVMDAQSFYATTNRSKNGWSSIAAWLTRFPTTFVGRRYSILLDRYELLCRGVALGNKPPLSQRDIPCAMCFPWDGVKGGLVVHNGTRLTDAAFSTTLPRGGKDVGVHVEGYREWLDAVASSGWAPNSPTNSAQYDEDDPLVAPQLSSRVLRACGNNPRDAWLLSWLLKATGHHAAAFERQLQVRIKGEAYVAATHVTMAGIIGLTVQQVRDAVVSLTERGLVRRPPKGKHGTGRKTVLFVDHDSFRRAVLRKGDKSR